MSTENTIYYLTLEDLNNDDILFNHIYPDTKNNYFFSDDFSKEFYIKLAYSGFISTSLLEENQLYLLPEIQYEYAILDFKDLHISKKVKKLLNKTNNYDFSINTNLDLVLEKIENYHKPSWLIREYKELIKDLFIYNHPTIDFKIMSIELNDKITGELITGEIGYKIGSLYTSLTGFRSNEKKYDNWGTLQLVLLSKYLEKEKYSFWNLGHPYMKYKFDLGAKQYSREDFLNRWYKVLDEEYVDNELILE